MDQESLTEPVTGMTKNERLNKLFKKWEWAIRNGGKAFISDGIIDESKYERAGTKILFIGKEPHDTALVSAWDFREEWAKDPDWKHARQCKRWAYGILNDFPVWEEAKEPPENTLLQVACMNVKKTGGGSSSIRAEIEHHVRAHAEHIRTQVEIIDPDIIIGGLRGWGIWDILLPGLNHITVESIGVFHWGRAKVIDFYHPSNRYPHAMSYALLGRIMRDQGS